MMKTESFGGDYLTIEGIDIGHFTGEFVSSTSPCT